MSEGYDGKAELDVIEILTADHKEMIDLIGRIGSTSDLNERRDLADTLIAEVMRHAVAEEMFVYPAIEEHVPNGAGEVEHDKQEHDQIVKVMKGLEKAEPSDPAFMQLVHSLEDLLRHHADDEESDQFPKLKTHISSDELIDMGRRVENAKKLAPTRPHPHAPHSELFHKSIGPGVGMVDRLLDKLTGRQTN